MRPIDADALIDDLKHDVAADQDSLDYEEFVDITSAPNCGADMMGENDDIPIEYFENGGI